MYVDDYPRSALANRVVLLRADLNLPIESEGPPLSQYRVTEAMQTVRYLVECGARILLLTHLGRPKVRDDTLSTLQLQPVLQNALPGVFVVCFDACVGNSVALGLNKLAPGSVALLENVRFHTGETTNDPSFAAALMQHASAFVFDAFAVAHRCHASTVGVADFARSRGLPVMAGLLVRQEMDALSAVLRTPSRPLLAIIGGDKLTSKSGVVAALIGIADVVMLVGRVAVPFVCASMSSQEEAAAAKLVKERAAIAGTVLVTPSDFVVVRAHDADRATIVPATSISSGDTIMDVGSDTLATLSQLVRTSNTIFWNGPTGVFETPPFDGGTRQLVAMLSAATRRGTTTVVGGGHTVAAIKRCSGNDVCFSHISTGGGAMMAMLSGRPLPALDALHRASTATLWQRGALEEINRDGRIGKMGHNLDVSRATS